MSFGQVGLEVRMSGLRDVRKEKSACRRDGAVALAYVFFVK